MANNFSKNFTEKVNRITTEHFENSRTISKTVNTQLLNGQFDADSGEKVLFKRPTDDVVIETSDGDISASNDSPFITGTAFGEVQDYITVYKKVSEAEQALKFGSDSERFFGSIARRMVTQLELNFAKFAMKNANLSVGTPGTAVTKWSEVADAQALLESTGVPMGSDWSYVMNPYTMKGLADVQANLGAADSLVKDAFTKATIYSDFAGMRVMKGTTLPKYTTGVGADRVGIVAANPDVSYVTAKDTMTQQIAVSGLSANMVIPAGQVIKITGRKRLNLSTRELLIDESGSGVDFTAVVLNDVTLDGTGAGTITISGAAIFEAGGAYNTVDSAPVTNDAITLLGGESSIIQPNLFYHRDAYAIGFAPMEKLSATDSFYQSEDGIQIRVSKDSDFTKNTNLMRFDMRPAYAALNPFMAGHGHGTP